jgi:hypothetical protein
MVCALRSFELGKEGRAASGASRSRAFASFLSVHEPPERWARRSRTCTIPRLSFRQATFCERLKVLTVPNVLSIVGTRTCPSVVSDDEISWIKSGVEHGGLKPHSYLEVGTRVVVMSGVAAGMEGILLRKHNNVRILVALDSIAQAFVIEIDGALVKPVGGKLACATSAFQIQEAPRRRINSSDDDPAVHRTS